ncbi:hypothetical protein OPT61_g7756 [Boeremia exigua]|uniref:Uncharacterized protein n=1 Tax=Boeremia exigua TaxID=749465 RepID=A0ACC2I1M9_9PLEO|nr:hypothetical protein OPT61_g7756 [Boeremia exigua]
MVWGLLLALASGPAGDPHERSTASSGLYSDGLNQCPALVMRGCADCIHKDDMETRFAAGQNTTLSLT